MIFSVLNGLVFLIIAIAVTVLVEKHMLRSTFYGKLMLLALTIEHFIITFVFSFFLEKFTTINDPQRFYNIALKSGSWLDLFGFGNSFMSFLVYPLAKIGLTLQTCFFIFSFFGWLGLIKILELLDIKSLNKIHFYYLYFFLPSLHLWTSSLSKEPLLLFFIAIILSSANNIIKTKKVIFWFSFLMILLIRPHVFFLLSTSYLILYHLKIQRINNNLIALFVFCFIGVGYLGVKYFLKLDTFSISEILDFLVTSFEQQSKNGNTAISIAETNIFERFFYLLLMPLPYLYESQSIFQLLASIENIFYVMVFGYLIFKLIKRAVVKNLVITRFDVLYAFVNTILMIVFFGSYIYNQGLANRMRIMIYPFLFYVLISNINSVKLKDNY